MNIPINDINTPAYIVDENLLINNLEILKRVMDKTNCKILLAQKGFSMFYFYPLISKYLKGTTASGIFEAKLGYEEMGGEVHVYSPAFKSNEIDELINIVDHIVFNSFDQVNKFIEKVKTKKISVGIRVNPEYAEVETEIYNPCSKNSRLGVKIDDFEKHSLEFIDGIHFHTMCEQNSDVLKRTFEIFEAKFGKYLYNMKWVNFGGGHHITKKDYDLKTLVDIINYVKNKYHIEVYIEPGEAIALNTGFLVSTVIDVIKNDIDIAILDTSAACHMPDVLEMPYRPEIINSGKINKYKNNYILAGPTCLAGDIIGEYSFEKKLINDEKLVFCDMAHYTMVKNNTFNGMKLPSIYVYDKNKKIKLIKEFGYLDFKNRLS